MSDYEKMLLGIVINAGEKLIDAMTLNNTGYSYRNSWFLSVISEEEMAKLIILPFANFAGTLSEMAERKSIAYKHPVKQKVFKTFGIQNRDNLDIEKLKQELLYVKPDTGFKPVRVVTPSESGDELLHAIKLFDQIAVVNLLSSNSLSEDFKQKLIDFTSKIFIPAVKELSPSSALAMQQKYINPRPTMIEAFSTHPLMFAEMVKKAIPETYQDYFREIEGKSYTESILALDKYL